MSSTRHATDSGFHQERFCSAAEFEKGLLANLVAKRCEMISEPADRELVWFLQHASHRQGLDSLAAELVNRFSGRIGKGKDPAVSQRKRFARQAAIARHISAIRDGRPIQNENTDVPHERDNPAGPDFDRIKTDDLPKALAELCTDPGCSVQDFRPWFFESLVEALRECMSGWIEAQRSTLATTQLSSQVFETLTYALESGGIVVLDGPPLRIGKSYAGRTWCELHPGQARFVQVPATNDDIGFFRAIAQALGSASALSFKGVQLRERVEMTLQSSKLMLVLDNAHYLWPQSNRREALPNRLNWLLTSLVNHGVSVALLTTPQFARDQQIVEKKTGWTSAQFLSQIGEYKKLPQLLSRDELLSIAKLWLPAGEKNSIKALALYAEASGRYLAAIETAVKRARFLAGKDGRGEISFEDVGRAINEYVIPSDLALKESLARGSRRVDREIPAASAAAPVVQNESSIMAAAPPAHPGRGVRPGLAEQG